MDISLGGGEALLIMALLTICSVEFPPRVILADFSQALVLKLFVARLSVWILMTKQRAAFFVEHFTLESQFLLAALLLLVAVDQVLVQLFPELVFFAEHRFLFKLL